MSIRMVHPEHGATHAYNSSEIERLKAQGWTVEAPEPTEAPKKKPGPKPKAK